MLVRRRTTTTRHGKREKNGRWLIKNSLGYTLAAVAAAGGVCVCYIENKEESPARGTRSRELSAAPPSPLVYTYIRFFFLRDVQCSVCVLAVAGIAETALKLSPPTAALQRNARCRGPELANFHSRARAANQHDRLSLSTVYTKVLCNVYRAF